MTRRTLLRMAPMPAAGFATSAALRVLPRPPFDPALRHERDFRPSRGLRQLSEHLHVYEDSCNVYIVRQGSRAALIEFGTGGVLGVLDKIGVTAVDRVLVTHHHRDQVQGLADLARYDFRVTVPGGEAHLFENVESFWKDVQIYINYDLRSWWNTVRRSIRVDEKVAGGGVVRWGGIDFRVLDTPGHTDKSISYVASIDGRTVVFTGDLIAGPGKLTNWYDMHWAYYGFTQGIDASEGSFDRLMAMHPEMLLPSHGDPMSDPEAAIGANRKTYSVLRGMLPPNSSGRSIGEMRHILPHLVHVGGPKTVSPGFDTSYAILAGNGRALLYDYGYVDLEHIQKFKKQFGIRHITLTYSHYHDDHVNRTYELLRGQCELTIWVFERMADILAHPTRYRLPCLLPYPVVPDRVIHDGERIEWEGYTLEFFHLPGQTEFHQGLFTVIDGKKVLFTGDNTWNKRDPGRVRNGPLVPQNEYFLDGGFIKCAEKMLQYMPDIVCPAHTEEYSPTREDLEQFLGWAKRLRQVMTGLILQPDPNFGMDYRWCHFYPFRVVASGNEPFRAELIVRNHLFLPGKLEVRLKLPDDVACSERDRTFTMEPKSQVAVPFLLHRTGGSGRRVAMADVTFNGRRMGEIAEFLID